VRQYGFVCGQAQNGEERWTSVVLLITVVLILAGRAEDGYDAKIMRRWARIFLQGGYRVRQDSLL